MNKLKNYFLYKIVFRFHKKLASVDSYDVIVDGLNVALSRWPGVNMKSLDQQSISVSSKHFNQSYFGQLKYFNQLYLGKFKVFRSVKFGSTNYFGLLKVFQSVAYISFSSKHFNHLKVFRSVKFGSAKYSSSVSRSIIVISKYFGQ